MAVLVMLQQLQAMVLVAEVVGQALQVAQQPQQMVVLAARELHLQSLAHL